MDSHGDELEGPLNSKVSGTRRVGVVGAGWAGLAAAVELVRAGWAVSLWEMAPVAGGRARSGVAHKQPDGTALELDAGQHILIGAYTETLRLIRSIGVDLNQVLWRHPLTLVDVRGRGLRVPRGRPIPSFLRALAGHPDWSLSDRARLLWRLAQWQRQGFRAEAGLSVAELCAGLPAAIQDELIEPLCVAALNTPSSGADAGVFLRVLRDGLFAGPGGSDLLVPSQPLHALWPGPALEELRRHHAQVRLGQRVQAIDPLGAGRWRVQAGPQAEEVDRLIVASSAGEAARLLEPWDPEWSAIARGLRFEPIVTTWVQAPGVRLACPMIRLDEGPAQFAFDLAALGWPWPGGLSLVSSNAAPWLEQGLPALEAAALRQAQQLPGVDPATVSLVRSIAERRATFRCEPQLRRPPGHAAAAHGGLWVAGDHVDGPYPSTLEGAVRAGVAAAHHVKNS